MPKVLDVKGNKVVGWRPSADSGRTSSTGREMRSSVAQRQIRPESVREWSPSSGTWWPSDHPLTPLGCRSAGTPLTLAQDCRITRRELLVLFYRSLGDSGRSSILSVLSLGLGLERTAFRALSSCSAFSLAANASALSELARACSLIDDWLCGG